MVTLRVGQRSTFIEYERCVTCELYKGLKYLNGFYKHENEPLREKIVISMRFESRAG